MGSFHIRCIDSELAFPFQSKQTIMWNKPRLWIWLLCLMSLMTEDSFKHYLEKDNWVWLLFALNCVLDWQLVSYMIFYMFQCHSPKSSHPQSRFDARYWMLGAGALGWPRGMEWGGRREEGSGWGTHVYLWQIHLDIWQN